MQWARITEAQNILGEGEPWEHGALGPITPIVTPIKLREHSAKHCFSACLFHEPTFEARFPNRSWRERYMGRCAASIEPIEHLGFHLNIIADRASLDAALSLNAGSVFLCEDEPRAPFAKHLFRYYSVLLPPHPTIEFYHFRGMDNILKSDDEQSLMRQFERSGCDVLRSPYLPIKKPKRRYISVRGSCSVNRRGAAALAHFLTSVPMSAQRGRKAFHCDEFHLDKWWRRDWRYLKSFTLVDRNMPREFYRELQESIEAKVDQTIQVRVRAGGPMSSVK